MEERQEERQLTMFPDPAKDNMQRLHQADLKIIESWYRDLVKRAALWRMEQVRFSLERYANSLRELDQARSCFLGLLAIRAERATYIRSSMESLVRRVEARERNGK
jgi:hypothetical protein